MIQSIPQTPWATPDRLDMPGLMAAFQAFWRENSGEEAVRLMALRLRHDAIPARQVLFSAELVARNSSV